MPNYIDFISINNPEEFFVTANASNSLKVLIVGGGVAGACAANKFAEHGIETFLIERKPFIGGYAAELGCKAADVCLKCSVCAAHDQFRRVLVNKKTHVLTNIGLLGLDSGDDGETAYRTRLVQNPRFINHDLCIACGACLKACPSKCIYQPYPGIYGGRPLIEAPKCLRTNGKSCSHCAKACPCGAINLEEKPRQINLPVNAVVIATGYQPFDPGVQPAYGYKALPNVITGLEAERQLAVRQKLVRPSDSQVPKRIAFIQCVGSRSELFHRRPEDTDYCSAVCCAYAMRTARKIKHVDPDAQITFFYMDLQNFGKDFTFFYRECRDKMKFVRARPSEVLPGNAGNALIKYEDQDKGAVGLEEYELVVLSIGMRPADDAHLVADQFLISADESGFFGIKGAAGISDSQKKNIFAIGACEAPKDIAACIEQAEAVSARILAMKK